jgi:thiamine-monophosphate kinase
MAEFELIKRLTSFLDIKDEDVLVGFGDDCACVNINGKKILFTADIQIENTHFIKEKTEPTNLGWKLISVNVSDIVACGGTPKWGVISIGVPKDLSISFLEDVYKGIKKAKQFYNLEIIGGNTSSSKEIIFDLFLTGETERFVSRSNAKDKDIIFISGYTGLSRAGLELILSNQAHFEPWEKQLIDKHFLPIAQIHLSERIQKYANACIDISDGLIADLGHISKMSRKKIRLTNIPISPILKKFAEKYSKDPLEYAFYGGEDYQLAFTTPKEYEGYFKDCFKIGYIEEGEGIYYLDKPVEIKGFEHL